MIHTLIIFNEKPHKTNPFAGSNSGVCKLAISARVLKQAAKNTKIRTIIPIRATY